MPRWLDILRNTVALAIVAIAIVGLMAYCTR